MHSLPKYSFPALSLYFVEYLLTLNLSYIILLLNGYALIRRLYFRIFLFCKNNAMGPQVEYNNLKIKKGESVQIRLRSVDAHPFYYGSIRAGWGYYFIISS